MLIVMAWAWPYVRFGSTPQAGWLLYGIKPVVIALIVLALWNLGRKAVKSPLTAVVGLAVLVLSLVGVNEIALLFAGTLLVMIGTNVQRLRKQALGAFLIPAFGGLSLLAPPALAAYLSVCRCCFSRC
jgi:chromate transporter